MPVQWFDSRFVYFGFFLQVCVCLQWFVKTAAFVGVVCNRFFKKKKYHWFLKNYRIYLGSRLHKMLNICIVILGLMNFLGPSVLRQVCNNPHFLWNRFVKFLKWFMMLHWFASGFKNFPKRTLVYGKILGGPPPIFGFAAGFQQPTSYVKSVF